jgi:hypothetical protein
MDGRTLRGAWALSPLLPHRARWIVLLCEGETETLATELFLRRQFEADGLKSIALQPINLKGKLGDIGDFTRRYRSDTRVAAVFTLVDLYGLPVPNIATVASLEDKVSAARAWLREQVREDADFFHPHVSVHELEAWFLAEGQALSKRLEHPKLRPDRQAERKNFDNPPNKRVDALFRQHLKHEYRKIIDGKPLLSELSHDAVIETCEFSRALYDDLVAVARGTLSA